MNRIASLTRMNRHILVLVLGLSGLLYSTALAWKIPTHVASANQLLEEISDQGSSKITPGTSPDVLTFKDPLTQRQLSIPVTVKDAFLAIKTHPTYFRGGVVGPDMFADFASGQTFQHGNETPAVWSAIESLKKSTTVPDEYRIPPTYSILDKSPTLKPLEDRTSPSQFRSIDFAMGMFSHYEKEFLSKANPAEKQKILAFMIGYIGHCVGDAFAHTWVNGKVGGAWSYTQGTGMFGTLTEEIKHVFIEGYVDHKVPYALFKNPESQELDKAVVAVPVDFLDSFFSRRLPIPAANNIGDINGDFKAFALFFSNLDQFQGGATYNFFNFQFEFANGAFLRWTRADDLFKFYRKSKDVVASMGWAVDFLQKHDPVDVLLNLQSSVSGLAAARANMPNQVSLATSQFGWNDIKCNDANVQLADVMIDLYWEIGAVEKRMSVAREFAAIARKNWVLMSQCTAENLAKINGPAFDPAKPNLNTDACMDMVRAKWRDETPNDPKSLYRGSFRKPFESLPYYPPEVQKFLDQTIDAFRGYTAEDLADPAFVPFEKANKHRNVSDILAREYGYLTTAGFTLDDYLDSGFPSNPVIDQACVASRTTGLDRKCLQEQWDNLLSWYYLDDCIEGPSRRLKTCRENFGSSWEDCVWSNCPSKAILQKEKCLSDVAKLKSGGNMDAGQAYAIQATLKANCRALAFETCKADAGVLLACKTKDKAMDLYCGALDIGDRIDCTTEIYDDKFNLEPTLGIILDKVEEFCDWRDETKSILTTYKSLDTEVKRREYLIKQGLPIDDYHEAVRNLEDLLAQKPDYYPVNLVFLKDDLNRSVKENTAYFGQVTAAVAAKRSEIESTWPTGADKTEALAAIAQLQNFMGQVNQDDLKYYFPYDKVDLDASLAKLGNTGTKVKLADAQTDMEETRDAVEDGVTDAEANVLITKVAAIRADLEGISFEWKDWSSPPGRDQRDKLLRAVKEMDSWLKAVKDDLAGMPDVEFNNFRVFKDGFENLVGGAENSKLVTKLVQLNVFPEIKGPTVLILDKEMGLKAGEDNFAVENFTPFYNTIQGLKLVPLTAKVDIENLFTAKSLGTNDLPWNANAASYSAVCKDPNNKNLMNVYCDVLTSNDDPSCHGCTSKPPKSDPNQSQTDYLEGHLEPYTNPANGVELLLKKGIVAYDEDGRNGIRSKFLFASTDATRTALYDNIFRTRSCNVQFTKQPNSKHVYPGNDVTLSAIAAGVGDDPLVYQWKRDGSDISGASAIDYVITGFNNAQHKGAYVLTALDACGRVITSRTASLEECADLVITQQPEDVVFSPGDGAIQLSVAVAGDGLTQINYQWQRQNRINMAWENIPSATSRVYVLTGNSSTSQGTYRVLVSQSCDGHLSSITSSSSVVTTHNSTCLERRPYSENIVDEACVIADVKTSRAKVTFDNLSKLGSNGDFVRFHLPDGSWYESNHRFTFSELSNRSFLFPKGTELVFTSDNQDDVADPEEFGYKVTVETIGGILPWLKMLFRNQNAN